MDKKSLPFMETIYHLRTIEELILYTAVLKVSYQEEKEAVEFLRDEYEKERLNYPFTAPDFDENAALWAAKFLYFSGQLLLNRSDTLKDLPQLLPKFKNKITASSLLSADLCLRFLPQIVLAMKTIDTEDASIPIIENSLREFHYSNIGYHHNDTNYNFKVLENNCLKQLYLNRITEQKDTALAKVPEINALLLADFGNYKNHFWKDFPSVETIS